MIKNLYIILITLLLLNTASALTLQIGKEKKSMPEVENAINNLKSIENKENAFICSSGMNFIVAYHKFPKTNKEAEQIKTSLEKLEESAIKIIDMPSANCFSNKLIRKKLPKPRKTLKGGLRIINNNKQRSVVKIKPYTKKFINKPVEYETTVYVNPERTTKIMFSNRDQNRITCQNGIVKDIIFSKENGAEENKHGKNAFIKFLIMKDSTTGEYIYADRYTKFDIICGDDQFYSILAKPVNIPGQHIILKDPIGRVKKNISLFKGKAFEEKLKIIAEQALKEKYPESYQKSVVNKENRALIQAGIKIKLKRVIKIHGEGLKIKEFNLILKQDHKKDKVNVTEKNFILNELSKNPVAITMWPLFIGKIHPTRLIIIEQ
ncbi:MAG: hypothetical protein GY714_09610 [Desulfobacterales bacterium]|nr:hypothetical protein [Desulfobacterales bacterium]